MKAFCTYCSRKKCHESGEIPAIRRYISSRIQKVYEAALAVNLPFYVLSGRFGLLEPQRNIPDYDYLLQADKVPELSGLVANQIAACQVEGFVFFIEPVASDQNVQNYLDALTGACTKLSLPLCVVELR
jgi:hypothetical protein